MNKKNVSGRRIGAAFIDLALYMCLCLAAFFLMAESTEGFVSLGNPNSHLQLGDRIWYVDGGKAGLLYLIDFASALVYFGVLPGLTGWTPGKLLTGLRVVRADRRRAGLGRNLARPFMWIVDGFPYFLPGLVGFVMILATKDHRRVADLVSGTDVVDRAEVGVPISDAAATPAAPAPDWYPDPSGAAGMRWWDGQAWTAHTR
jgi:uncharacterized RDD family membrane protein YckC